jgi:alanyl-tRNA synthetase
MLGNFSIAGYSKLKAIKFGYDFLVKELKMPLDKLYFTYFEDDSATYDK